MNKAELTEAVAQKAGISKKDAGNALDATLETIKGSLKKGDSVTLIGFGTFKVKKRGARTGRNPQTGQAIKIKAKRVATFTAGSDLKEAVK